DPDAPKRPNSSYFVFCIEKRPELMKANPEIGAKDITRLLGEGWRGLSKEEKEVYDAKYREGKEAYEKELTAYK
ncbi:high mobility group box, partial [Neoconidiobolus thromboides FSU 785]